MFDYYVYIYLNPLKDGNYNFGKYRFDYEPFYVGKGKNKRCLTHLYVIDNQNSLKQRILNKIRMNNKIPIIIKLRENITEYTAFRLEKYLINRIGRRDLKLGSLSNLTNGGDGVSGTIVTPKKRNNMISEKRPIVKYNMDGIVLEVFSNIIDLSIIYPQYRTNHIHRACKSNGSRKIDNCFWKYYNGESIGDIIELNDSYKSILQYDLDGNFIKKWDLIGNLHDVGYATGAILKCCRNNKRELKYYKFKNHMWYFTQNDFSLKIKPYCENNAKGSSRLILKHIKMYSIANELLGIYCPKELKNMGFNIKTIYRCCDKKFVTTQGYKWQWS